MNPHRPKNQGTARNLRQQSRVHHIARPTSFSLRSPHHGRATRRTSALFALPYPENSVTFLRHQYQGPATTAPHAVQRMPSICAVSSHYFALKPHIRALLICTHIRAKLVTQGSDCATEEPLPLDGGRLEPEPYSIRGKRGYCVTGRPVGPLSYLATRGDSCAPNRPLRHYRIARSRRRTQLRTQQNVTETNSFFANSLSGAVWPLSAPSTPLPWLLVEFIGES